MGHSVGDFTKMIPLHSCQPCSDCYVRTTCSGTSWSTWVYCPTIYRTVSSLWPIWGPLRRGWSSLSTGKHTHAALVWFFETPGPCLTTAIWRCRKHFSQWQRSFQRKLHSHLDKILVTASCRSSKTGPSPWWIRQPAQSEKGWLMNKYIRFLQWSLLEPQSFHVVCNVPNYWWMCAVSLDKQWSVTYSKVIGAVSIEIFLF